MQKIRNNFHFCILGILFATVILVWYSVLKEDRAGKLTIAFFDVGQGDAIFIESPSGNQILVDGGPDKSVLRQLGKVMPFYDRKIDALFVTNPDKDHFAGFIDVLRSYKVAAVIEPGTKGASAEYKVFEEEIRKEDAKHIIARRGQEIALGGGAFLQILFPDRDVSGLATNDGSIVAKLIYGNTAFLLTGDAPKGIENYLVDLDGKNLDVDVLKVGHHGSKTSTGDSLLGYASPAMAVISSGKNNRYGHPNEETLARLKRFEVEIYRTDQLGTIIMESDGENIRVK